MADQSAVGKELPPYLWEVERGKIRELVQAIGDNNPIYVDRNAAIKEGYQDTPASPTYITVPVQWSNILSKLWKEMKINFAKVLDGEQTYEYFREIYPGDILTGRMKIVSMDQKSGKAGPMDIVKLEIMHTNQKSEQVLKVTVVLIERK
jgi:acyl dehydratase